MKADDIKSFGITNLPYVPVVGLLMVISSIPYGWSAYARIATIILAAGYVFYYVVYRKWREIHWKKQYWMYVVMILLYLMFPLRQLFDPTDATKYFFSALHHHEWFLYVGIIGILGFSDKLKWRYVAYIMLLTSVVMAFHCGYLYWFTDEYDSFAPLERFDLLRRHHIHSHMVMNLYINTALVFGFCSLMELKKWWQKGIIIAAMLVSWAVILLSDGRTGTVASFLIVGGGSIYLLYRKNKYIGTILAIGAVIGLGILVSQRQRMSVERVSIDPRFAIWDYSVRMAKEKPVFGYGVSTLSVEYPEGAYQDSVMYNGFIRPIIESYPEFTVQGKTMFTHHPHNAFLTYWLEFGIIGVILLCALFMCAALLPVGEKRIFLWLFLIALLMQCTTEPIGAHLLPEFIAVMLFVWDCCSGCSNRAGNQDSCPC